MYAGFKEDYIELHGISSFNLVEGLVTKSLEEGESVDGHGWYVTYDEEKVGELQYNVEIEAQNVVTHEYFSMRWENGISNGTRLNDYQFLDGRLGYGIHNGEPIKPKSGWKILPWGVEVPSVHMEYDKNHGWLREKRCRSTMTPIYTRVWGHIKAYAVPDEQHSLVQRSNDKDKI